MVINHWPFDALNNSDLGFIGFCQQLRNEEGK